MPQSLANVIVHIVYSTKHRQPFIDAAIEPQLHAYLAGIAQNLHSPAIKIGGIEDHVHLACVLSRTITIADLVQTLKQDSSKWIKTHGDRYAAFAWQSGYGAFSVGQSQVPALKRYIGGQHEHHKSRDFQTEFRELLRKYQIEFDERYVWD